MKNLVIMTVTSLIALGGVWSTTAKAEEVLTTCMSSGNLNFLCGIQNPEDLVEINDGRWIVSSGMAPNSGLHLIDAEAKTWEKWSAATDAKPEEPFDACPSQPLADEMQIHGLSVRDNRDGHSTLYAVNHGGSEPTDLHAGGVREAIEIFDVDMTGPKPILAWKGCLMMPTGLVANAVVSDAIGAVYTTVMIHPTNDMADLWSEKPTGAVYKWTPGAKGFEKIEGSELTGNNGIEISPDGKNLYVNSIGTFTKLTNTNPATVINSVKLHGRLPDNMHWRDDRLIIAGPRTDLCSSEHEPVPCMAGYFVAEVDPETLTLETVAEGQANKDYNGTSSALLSGNTLWLGSFSDTKIAYRSIP